MNAKTRELRPMFGKWRQINMAVHEQFFYLQMSHQHGHIPSMYFLYRLSYVR